MTWYLRSAAATLGLGLAATCGAQPPTELPAIPIAPSKVTPPGPAIPVSPVPLTTATPKPAPQPPKSDSPVPPATAPQPRGKSDAPVVVGPDQPVDVVPEHLGAYTAGWCEFDPRPAYPGQGEPCGHGCKSLGDLVMPSLVTVFPQDGRFRVYGWAGTGIANNVSNPGSKYNGPFSAVDRTQEWVFNQNYTVLERVLPTDGSIGWGLRADLLFGQDFFLPQSRGIELDPSGNQRWNGTYYGLAIPQSYLELGSDVWSLKVGRFYSPVGYESVMAPNNFFYTHAYSYMFGQPYTLWGGLLTVQLTKNWQVLGGLTNGWDTLVGDFNNLNAVGGIKYTSDCRRWWASFALISGKNDSNPARLANVPTVAANRTRYSLLIGLLPGGPDGAWEYVFHNYYGWQEDGTSSGNFARWYGIDQYLFYRLTDTLRLGGRFEWFRDEDGTRVGLNRANNPNKPPLPGNYFSLATGVNWTPHPNILVRPELRWDFTSNTVRNAFSDGRSGSQLLLAADIIVRY